MRFAVIADAIVRTVKAATAPIVADVAGLSARLERLEARPPVPGPPGERGDPGVPGVAGLGFDDLAVEYDGHRTLTFALVRGAERQAWPIVLPLPINAGIFKHGKHYDVGDEITHRGSLWRCDLPTDESPPGNGWRLIVKKIRGEREP